MVIEGAFLLYGSDESRGSYCWIICDYGDVGCFEVAAVGHEAQEYLISVAVLRISKLNGSN